MSLKKLRLVALVCLFALFSSSLLAQQKSKKVSIQDGPESSPGKSILRYNAGNDETGAYMIRLKKMAYYIEHLNKSMQIDKSIKITNEKYKDLKTFFTEAFLINGNLYFFYVASDLKSGIIYHLYQKVNKSTLLPSGGFKLLNKISYPSKTTMRGASAIYGVNLIVSEDESKVMMYWNKPPRSDNDAQDDGSFNVSVMNAELTKLWDKELKIPTSTGFKRESIRLENNGEVYVLGIVDQDRKSSRESRRSGKPTYSYRFYRFTSDDRTISDMEFKLDDKFITDAKAVATPQGDILVTGFYSDKGTFSVKGAFNMLIDGQTEKIKHLKKAEFDTEFITQYMSERDAKKAKKQEAKGQEPELYQFELNEVLITESGSVTLVAEQYYTYTVCTTTSTANGGTSESCSDYYIYNDILILNFDPTGDLKWKCKIPKRQKSKNDGGYFSSYALTVIGDKIFFIYNDNPENIILETGKEPRIMNGRRGLVVMLVEVSGQGKVDREVLMTSEQGDVVVRPKVCKQTGSNELILYSERRMRVYQYSRVVFQ